MAKKKVPRGLKSKAQLANDAARNRRKTKLTLAKAQKLRSSTADKRLEVRAALKAGGKPSFSVQIKADLEMAKAKSKRDVAKRAHRQAVKKTRKR